MRLLFILAAFSFLFAAYSVGVVSGLVEAASEINNRFECVKKPY